MTLRLWLVADGTIIRPDAEQQVRGTYWTGALRIPRLNLLQDFPELYIKASKRRRSEAG